MEKSAPIFSQPYLSNGKAYGKVVVGRLSVCLSVVCNGYIVVKRCEIGLGCYWSLLGSSILALKWHKNRWPWMTLKCHNALWYANHAVLWLNGKSGVGDGPSERALQGDFHVRMSVVTMFSSAAVWLQFSMESFKRCGRISKTWGDRDNVSTLIESGIRPFRMILVFLRVLAKYWSCMFWPCILYNAIRRYNIYTIYAVNSNYFSICSGLAAILNAKLLPAAITDVRRIAVFYHNVDCGVRYSSVTV